MNHKHRKVLHAIFAHPVSANLSAKSIEAVLVEMGGHTEVRHGGRWGVRLGGHFAEFSHAGHAMPPDDVRKLKKFITDAGIDPEKDYPLREHTKE